MTISFNDQILFWSFTFDVWCKSLRITMVGYWHVGPSSLLHKITHRNLYRKFTNYCCVKLPDKQLVTDNSKIKQEFTSFQ